LLTRKAQRKVAEELAALRKRPDYVRRLIWWRWLAWLASLRGRQHIPLDTLEQRLISTRESVAAKELEKRPFADVLPIFLEIYDKVIPATFDDPTVRSQVRTEMLKYLTAHYEETKDQRVLEFFWKRRMFFRLRQLTGTRYDKRIFEWLKKQPYLATKKDRTPKFDMLIRGTISDLRHYENPADVIPFLKEIAMSSKHRYWLVAWGALLRLRGKAVRYELLLSGRDGQARRAALTDLLRQPYDDQTARHIRQ